MKFQEAVGNRVFLEVNHERVLLTLYIERIGFPTVESEFSRHYEGQPLQSLLIELEAEALGKHSLDIDVWPAIALACLRMRLKLRSYGYR